MALAIRDLGLLPYEEALALMRDLVGAVARGEAPDTLLVVTHPPVITLGRKRGARANVLAAGDIPVVEVERGGDATYHGPGQIVAYPVVKLAETGRDLHRFLRSLEDAVIRALATLGVAGRREPGLTGVWVGDRKIASLGIAVRNWVTYHGVALNVAPDPGFAAIRACGLDSAVMTSLAEVTGRQWRPDEVKEALVAAMREALEP
ncbi:MAG: lipoyl(octanoyl) transferase LipB [Candidatus Sericytochromatia bacterium]|nr:lipoyl(octanoyl) transferase LipB [Candidatus Tanganyikabacteria bacterium]